MLAWAAEMENRRYLKEVDTLRNELDVARATSNDAKRSTLACIDGTERAKNALSRKLDVLRMRNQKLSAD